MDRNFVEEMRSKSTDCHESEEQMYREWADEMERLQNLVARLKLEAQGHAQEARTANATIAEAYQVATGATGEPGNWNGANPIREEIERLQGIIQKIQNHVIRPSKAFPTSAKQARNIYDRLVEILYPINPAEMPQGSGHQ